MAPSRSCVTSDDESPDSPVAAPAWDAARETDWGCEKAHDESSTRMRFGTDAPATPRIEVRVRLAPAASSPLLSVEPGGQSSAGISHSRTSAPGCVEPDPDIAPDATPDGLVSPSIGGTGGILKLYMPRKCSGPEKYPDVLLH